jgi:N-methylhydantoinase A
MRIGVDTGGTFTDLVLVQGTEVRTAKLSSTGADPSRAVLEGLAVLGGVPRAGEVVHGTTVALNALLTGRAARTALVTNAGFRDLLEIARQERPDIYALHPRKPLPLVPRELRFELGQRSWPVNGEGLVEVQRPSDGEIEVLAERVRACGVQSVAVCLLHSYADPSIEARMARALERRGLSVTCSAAILPAYREIERFSTAIVNAALVPVLSAYLEHLSSGLAGAKLSIMQSAGGTLEAARAAREPVRVLFSGPAGGVVGAAHAAAEAELPEIVTLDMGGTSTDVAFHRAGAGLAGAVHDARIGGHPVAVKSLDVHTIGCGGGSLVTIDAGGVLHVGPGSAGADPGPVCYGRGEELTVTDAHVLLGHIGGAHAGGFLAGGLELDIDAVERAFEKLARKLGVRPIVAAEGVLEVARAAMRRAIGVMTMQRGHDPRRLPLVAFGGAGGLAAAPLAESLAMRGALVPQHPGLLSAHGMARASAVCDLERSVLAPLAAWPVARRRKLFSELASRAREELRAAGVPARAIALESSASLRYRGQSYEIEIAECADPAKEFHARHDELYGWRLDAGEIELVQFSVRASARAAPPRVARVRARALDAGAISGRRRAHFGRRLAVPIVDRAALAPGTRFEGPAIVEEFSGTTLVPPRWSARVTNGGHLWLERG